MPSTITRMVQLIIMSIGLVLLLISLHLVGYFATDVAKAQTNSLMPSSNQQYKDTKFGFEINYPYDWIMNDDTTVFEGTPSSLSAQKILANISLLHFCSFEQLDMISKINRSCGALRSTNDREIVSLTVKREDKFQSLPEYTQFVFNNLSWFDPVLLFSDSAQITQSFPATLGGMDAYKIVIEAEDNGMKHRDIGMFTVNDGIVYKIFYGIPDSNYSYQYDFSPEAKAIVDSFILANVTSSSTEALPTSPLPTAPPSQAQPQPQPPTAPPSQAQPQPQPQPSLDPEQNQVQQGTPVIVVSQYSYFEPIEYLETLGETIGGDFHIVGEVQNISPAKVEGVEVIATLYDSNNQVVGVESSYAKLSTLFPNQKSPFDIVIYRDDLPAQASSYALAINWR